MLQQERASTDEMKLVKSQAVVRIHPEEWTKPISVEHFMSNIKETRDIGLEYRVCRYISETAEMVTCLDKGGTSSGKDRYRDILPLSSSRVKMPDNGYINASYLSSPNSEKAFIAAQAPIGKTVFDFWVMILCHKVSFIFTLCNLIEENREKCYEYWPGGKKAAQHKGLSGSLGDCITFTPDPLKGNVKDTSDARIAVVLENEEMIGTSLIKRVLNIQATSVKGVSSESHRLEQYHYITWPDHGVPNTPELVSLWRHFDSSCVQLNPGAPPILVHCSAGVGRTGCLIALQNLVSDVRKQLNSQEASAECNPSVSVLNTLKLMRDSRPFMIQTTSQYLLVYEAFIDILPHILRAK